jgi:CRISPR associated protein Cas1
MMGGLAAGETATEVLARAASRGTPLTERKLKRLHVEGLLPKPQQTWPQGQGGSTTLYPVGTADQLVALLNIQAKFYRSIDIGWRLWWLGFLVDEKYYLQHLKSWAVRYDELMPKIVKSLGSQGDLRAIWSTRMRNSIFRQLRRRVGKNDFDLVLSYIVRILKGDFDGWDSYVDPEDDGLDPRIGYLHTATPERQALVLDLMEPQRPLVDRRVLEFVQAHTFHPADFTIRSDGVCRLNPEMVRQVAW